MKTTHMDQDAGESGEKQLRRQISNEYGGATTRASSSVAVSTASIASFRKGSHFSVAMNDILGVPPSSLSTASSPLSLSWPPSQLEPSPLNRMDCKDVDDDDDDSNDMLIDEIDTSRSNSTTGASVAAEIGNKERMQFPRTLSSSPRRVALEPPSPAHSFESILNQSDDKETVEEANRGFNQFQSSPRNLATETTESEDQFEDAASTLQSHTLTSRNNTFDEDVPSSYQTLPTKSGSLTSRQLDIVQRARQTVLRLQQQKDRAADRLQQSSGNLPTKNASVLAGILRNDEDDHERNSVSSAGSSGDEEDNDDQTSVSSVPFNPLNTSFESGQSSNTCFEDAAESDPFDEEETEVWHEDRFNDNIRTSLMADTSTGERQDSSHADVKNESISFVSDEGELPSLSIQNITYQSSDEDEPPSLSKKRSVTDSESMQSESKSIVPDASNTASFALSGPPNATDDYLGETEVSVGAIDSLPEFSNTEISMGALDSVLESPTESGVINPEDTIKATISSDQQNTSMRNGMKGRPSLDSHFAATKISPFYGSSSHSVDRNFFTSLSTISVSSTHSASFATSAVRSKSRRPSASAASIIDKKDDKAVATAVSLGKRIIAARRRSIPSRRLGTVMSNNLTTKEEKSDTKSTFSSKTSSVDSATVSAASSSENYESVNNTISEDLKAPSSSDCGSEEAAEISASLSEESSNGSMQQRSTAASGTENDTLTEEIDMDDPTLKMKDKSSFRATAPSSVQDDEEDESQLNPSQRRRRKLLLRRQKLRGVVKQQKTSVDKDCLEEKPVEDGASTSAPACLSKGEKSPVARLDSSCVPQQGVLSEAGDRYLIKQEYDHILNDGSDPFAWIGDIATPDSSNLVCLGASSTQELHSENGRARHPDNIKLPDFAALETVHSQEEFTLAKRESVSFEVSDEAPGHFSPLSACSPSHAVYRSEAEDDEGRMRKLSSEDGANQPETWLQAIHSSHPIAGVTGSHSTENMSNNGGDSLENREAETSWGCATSNDAGHAEECEQRKVQSVSRASSFEGSMHSGIVEESEQRQVQSVSRPSSFEGSIHSGIVEESEQRQVQSVSHASSFPMHSSIVEEESEQRQVQSVSHASSFPMHSGIVEEESEQRQVQSVSHASSFEGSMNSGIVEEGSEERQVQSVCRSSSCERSIKENSDPISSNVNFAAEETNNLTEGRESEMEGSLNNGILQRRETHSSLQPRCDDFENNEGKNSLIAEEKKSDSSVVMFDCRLSPPHGYQLQTDEEANSSEEYRSRHLEYRNGHSFQDDDERFEPRRDVTECKVKLETRQFVQSSDDERTGECELNEIEQLMKNTMSAVDDEIANLFAEYEDNGSPEVLVTKQGLGTAAKTKDSTREEFEVEDVMMDADIIFQSTGILFMGGDKLPFDGKSNQVTYSIAALNLITSKDKYESAGKWNSEHDHSADPVNLQFEDGSKKEAGNLLQRYRGFDNSCFTSMDYAGQEEFLLHSHPRSNVIETNEAHLNKVSLVFTEEHDVIDIPCTPSGAETPQEQSSPSNSSHVDIVQISFDAGETAVLGDTMEPRESSPGIQVVIRPPVTEKATLPLESLPPKSLSRPDMETENGPVSSERNTSQAGDENSSSKFSFHISNELKGELLSLVTNQPSEENCFVTYTGDQSDEISDINGFTRVDDFQSVKSKCSHVATRDDNLNAKFSFQISNALKGELLSLVANQPSKENCIVTYTGQQKDESLENNDFRRVDDLQTPESQCPPFGEKTSSHSLPVVECASAERRKSKFPSISKEMKNELLSLVTTDTLWKLRTISDPGEHSAESIVVDESATDEIQNPTPYTPQLIAELHEVIKRRNSQVQIAEAAMNASKLAILADFDESNALITPATNLNLFASSAKQESHNMAFENCETEISVVTDTSSVSPEIKFMAQADLDHDSQRAGQTGARIRAVENVAPKTLTKNRTGTLPVEDEERKSGFEGSCATNETYSFLVESNISTQEESAHSNSAMLQTNTSFDTTYPISSEPISAKEGVDAFKEKEENFTNGTSSQLSDETWKRAKGKLSIDTNHDSNTMLPADSSPAKNSCVTLQMGNVVRNREGTDEMSADGDSVTSTLNSVSEAYSCSLNHLDHDVDLSGKSFSYSNYYQPKGCEDSIEITFGTDSDTSASAGVSKGESMAMSSINKHAVDIQTNSLKSHSPSSTLVDRSVTAEAVDPNNHLKIMPVSEREISSHAKDDVEVVRQAVTDESCTGSRSGSQLSRCSDSKDNTENESSQSERTAEVINRSPKRLPADPVCIPSNSAVPNDSQGIPLEERKRGTALIQPASFQKYDVAFEAECSSSDRSRTFRDSVSGHAVSQASDDSSGKMKQIEEDESTTFSDNSCLKPRPAVDASLAKFGNASMVLPHLGSGEESASGFTSAVLHCSCGAITTMEIRADCQKSHKSSHCLLPGHGHHSRPVAQVSVPSHGDRMSSRTSQEKPSILSRQPSSISGTLSPPRSPSSSKQMYEYDMMYNMMSSSNLMLRRESSPLKKNASRLSFRSPTKANKPKRLADIIRKELWSHNPAIVEEGLNKLIQLADSEAANIARTGGLLAVVQSMEHNIDHKQIQIAACKTLEKLAIDHDNEVAIAEVGGLEAILNSMMAHFEDEDVHEAAWSALWNLTCHPSNADSTANQEAHSIDDSLDEIPSGMEVLVNCMMAHMESAPVQSNACGTLANLCQSAERFDSMRKAGGLVAIATALEKHWDSPDLRREASYAMISLLEPQVSDYAASLNEAGQDVVAIEDEYDIDEDKECD